MSTEKVPAPPRPGPPAAGGIPAHIAGDSGCSCGCHGPKVERAVSASKAGRNDPCPCGSGRKHKKCCGR